MRSSCFPRGAAALAALAAFALAGCGAIPDKPAPVTLYDFGTAAVAPASPAAAATLAPLLLASIDAQARLDGTQVLYRLGYADANALRPYSMARWSVAPTQLIGNRLRDALSQRRVVLGPREGGSVARVDGRMPMSLFLTLDEFCQYFDAPGTSVGLVRVHATLMAGGNGGDRVLGQRSFSVREPAPSADAPGGVRALATASDGLIAQIVQWTDTLQAQAAR